jgi:hypothetical protein
MVPLNGPQPKVVLDCEDADIPCQRDPDAVQDEFARASKK